MAISSSDSRVSVTVRDLRQLQQLFVELISVARSGRLARADAVALNRISGAGRGIVLGYLQLQLPMGEQGGRR
jgi:hypothetical protein